MTMNHRPTAYERGLSSAATTLIVLMGWLVPAVILLALMGIPVGVVVPVLCLGIAANLAVSLHHVGKVFLALNRELNRYPGR